MAEAIILSPLVQVILDNATSLIKEHIGTISGAKSDLKKLSKTMLLINGVLRDAEEKQVNDEAVRNWLKELKDAAFDVDDILDEWATEALRWKIQSTPWTHCRKENHLFQPLTSPGCYIAWLIQLYLSFLLGIFFKLSALSTHHVHLNIQKNSFPHYRAKEQTLQISPYKSPTPSPSSKSLLKNDQPLPGVTIQYAVKHPAEVGDKFSLFGYVSRIEFKNALWYESCPYCNKKIKKDEDGSCCPSYSSSQPPSTLRYLLRAHLVDWTQEELSVTLFDEASQQILGQSAAEMLASFDDQDKLQEAVMEKMKDPFIFNVTRQERKFPDGRVFPQYIVDSVQEGLIPVKRRKLGFQFTNA